MGVARIEGAGLSREETVGHLAQIFPLVNAAIDEDSARFNYTYEGRVPLDINLPEKVDRWAPRIQASGDLMETGLSFYGAYHLDGEGQPRTAPTDMLGMLILRRGDNEEFPDAQVMLHNLYVYPHDPADANRPLRSGRLAHLLIGEALRSVPPELSVIADVSPDRTEVFASLQRRGFIVTQAVVEKAPGQPGSDFVESRLEAPAALVRQSFGVQ